MYTRCPHCATIFRVTAEELRTTHGDVPCVTCTQPFNALESLSDDITTLIAAPVGGADSTAATVAADEQPLPDAEEEPADDAGVAQDDAEDTRRQPIPDLSGIDPEDHADDDRDDEEPEDETTSTTGDDGETEDLAEADDEQADDSSDDQLDEQPEEPLDADESQPADDELPPDSMEFDAPEQTWTRFFISNDAPAPQEGDNREPTFDDKTDLATPEAVLFGDDSAAGQPLERDADTESLELQTADHDEWKRFLAEVNENDSAAPKSQEEEETEKNAALAEPEWPNDADPALGESLTEDFTTSEPTNEDEIPIIPPWLADETAGETAPEQRHGFRPSWPILGACAALALLLAGQLLHYNRDALAAHASYGGTIRQVYDLLGAPLYPDWPLDTFEVTGTEAITGQSNQDALDILANVIVHGRQPIGLPLIRVMLRDRWANPVATRVFHPDEYLRDFDAAQSLVMPGTALAVEISVADPGVEALSYVIDVCLPRRKTGLECQIAKDPFQ